MVPGVQGAPPSAYTHPIGSPSAWHPVRILSLQPEPIAA